MPVPMPEDDGSDLAVQEVMDDLTFVGEVAKRLKRLWQAQDRPGRRVERTHAADFVARVRYWAAQPDREGRRGLGHFQPTSQESEEALAGSRGADSGVSLFFEDPRGG